MKENIDYIVCKECNKKLKSINSVHLQSSFCTKKLKDVYKYKIKYPESEIRCQTYKDDIKIKLKNKIFTKEHRKNLSDAAKGKTLTKEHKEKLSKAKKGKTWEEIFGKKGAEQRMKLFKGKPSWNKGLTKETDNRIKKYADKANGRKMPKEQIEKMRKNFRENPPVDKHKLDCTCFVCVYNRTGKHNRRGMPCWSKGQTKETNPILLQHSYRMTDWDFYEKYGCKKINYPYNDNFSWNFKNKIRNLYDNKCVVTGMTNEEHIKKYEFSLSIHHWLYNKNETNPFYFVPVTCVINGMANTNRAQWIDMFNGIAEDKYCELLKEK